MVKHHALCQGSGFHGRSFQGRITYRRNTKRGDSPSLDGATYKWHVNDGAEVYVVLDGVVDMFYREGGKEKSSRMIAGDICHAKVGDEHVAHPVGEARILFIE